MITSNMHRGFRFALAAVAGLFASAAFATDYDLKTDTVNPLALTAADTCTNTDETTKDLTFDIGGTTAATTCAAKITGNIRVVKMGTGTLILSGDNAYTGGTSHQDGTLQAGSTTAFGAANTTIKVEGATDTRRFLYFPVDGDYHYNVERTATTTKLLYLYFGGAVNFYGNITENSGLSSPKDIAVMSGYLKREDVSPNVVVFNVSDGKTGNRFYGEISLPKVSFYNCCRFDCSFYGKVTCGAVASGTGRDSVMANTYDGLFRMLNAENAIGDVSLRYGNVSFETAGALTSTATLKFNASGVAASSKALLQGVDQTVAAITGKTGGSSYRTAEKDSGCIDSAKPATLTLAATANGATDYRLDGQVSLVYDPTKTTVTQKFEGVREHPTTGVLTAKGGTLELGGTTTWKSLSAINVLGADARVLVSSTAATPLQNLPYLKIDAGTFEVSANDHLTARTIVDVVNGGKLKLADGVELTVGCVYTNGARVAQTDYAAADWLEAGTGAKVTVAGVSGLTVNTWIGGNGNWTTAAGWSTGAVPTANGVVEVTLAGPTSTTTVDGVTAQLDRLTIGNAVAGKANVVRVTQGGALQAKSTVQTSSSILVKAGGRLEVTGGDADNAGGQVIVAPCNSDATALVVEKGGVLDVSGYAKVGMPAGVSAGKFFGDGEITFREHSSFGRFSDTAASTLYFAAGSGSPTGTVRFVDSATFRNGTHGFYLTRGKGTTAQLVFAGTSTDNYFQWCAWVGGGDARGEVIVTDGKVTSANLGIKLGNNETRNGVSGEIVSEGLLRVAGTGLFAVSVDNTKASKNLNGIVAGDAVSAKTNSTGKVLHDYARGYVEVADQGMIDFGYADGLIILGVGSTNAFGRLTQTGGTIRDAYDFVPPAATCYGAIIVGMGGGTGEWLMEGGTATLNENVYVGGALIADLNDKAFPENYKGEDAEHAGKARGLLKLTGGTMKIGANLILSKDGVGTLYLGKDADLKVTYNLDARPGSKLVVDLRGFTDKRKTLATFGGTTTAFAEENITVLTDEGVQCRLAVTDTAIVAKRVVGMTVIVR